MGFTLVLKGFSGEVQDGNMAWSPDVPSLCYESQHMAHPCSLTSYWISQLHSFMTSLL